MYENKNKNIKEILLKTFGDPVLIYTALIMMAVMYHYHSSFTAVYGLISLLAGSLVFKLFDYIQKHSFTGGLGYVALSMAVLYASKQIMSVGMRNYPLNFMVWFLTPQDALDFCIWYTIVIFLLFLMFMLSVVYYFTKVRYRVFMGFMIFIIPFTIYGKEYEKMPVGFIILLSVAYILIMIKYRQLSDADSVTVVEKGETWKSVAVYAVIFASVSAIVPKPSIEADRTVLETLISAEQFTDKLLSMLSIFQDTSTGDQFRNLTSEVPLYFVSAEEPLKFKTKTYTYYNFSSDIWSVSDDDTYSIVSSHTRNSVELTNPSSLIQNLLLAVSLDSDFAETYGLESLKGKEVKVPPSKLVKAYSAVADTIAVPLPSLASKLVSTSYSEDLILTLSGVIFANGSYKERFGYNEYFSVKYIPDQFFSNESNREIISAFSDIPSYSYRRMLEDACDVLYNADYLNEEYEMYEAVDECEEGFLGLIDYGENERIKSLAEEITKDCTNDYQKALALESYFYLNDYNYDLSYRKPKGENAEDFIFNTKRGVCYEYATAMVLLARSVGIPARYCEGYNMSTLYANSKIGTNYIITGKDAHGFPELYIRGFGWLPFEPTLTNEPDSAEKGSAVGTLAKAGIIIFLTAVLFLLGIFFYPEASHRFFIFRYRKKSPNDTVKEAMHRICRIYGIKNIYTSNEASELVQKLSGADVQDTAVLFDSVVYGGAVLNEKDKEKVMAQYITAYECLKNMKKSREQIKIN